MKESWPLPLASWLPLVLDTKGRNRFFGLGEVRLAVMSLIGETPRNGYQLIKELATRLGPLYHSSSGTVYPVLKQLEKEGLAESHLDEGRNLYRLTKAGRKALSGEAEAVAGIWRRAEQVEDLGQQIGPHSVVIAGPLSELHATALRASAWSAGDPNREDQVRGILRNASAELHQLMTAGGEEKKR